LAAEMSDPGAESEAGLLAFGCPEAEPGEGLSMCCGYVTFSIKPRASLAAGTSISNKGLTTFEQLDTFETNPSSTVTIAERTPFEPSDPCPASSPEGGETVISPDGLRLSWSS